MIFNESTPPLSINFFCTDSPKFYQTLFKKSLNWIICLVCEEKCLGTFWNFKLLYKFVYSDDIEGWKNFGIFKQSFFRVLICQSARWHNAFTFHENICNLSLNLRSHYCQTILQIHFSYPCICTFSNFNENAFKNEHSNNQRSCIHS